MSACRNRQIAGPCSSYYKDGGAPPCASEQEGPAPSASANKGSDEIAFLNALLRAMSSHSGLHPLLLIGDRLTKLRARCAEPLGCHS